MKLNRLFVTMLVLCFCVFAGTAAGLGFPLPEPRRTVRHSICTAGFGFRLRLPTAALVSITGRLTTANGNPMANAISGLEGG